MIVQNGQIYNSWRDLIIFVSENRKENHDKNHRMRTSVAWFQVF